MRGTGVRDRGGFVAVRAICLLVPILLASCSEDLPQAAAEIENAVEAYLSERTDLRLDQMSIRAERIRYDGDRAVVSVAIVASDDAKASMSMIYELERDGNGWRVVPSVVPAHPPLSESGGSGASSGLPPGHPPTVQPGSGLPPGHPPLTRESN